MFIWILLILLLGGFITGVTSFGSNLFAVPLLTLVTDFKNAVILTLLGLCPIWIAQAWLYRRFVTWGEIVPLCLVGIVGGPFGAWLLAVANPLPLLLGASLAIMAILVWLACNRFLKREGKPVKSWLAIPAGFMSGAMLGAIGMGGPPLIIYAYLRHWSKKATIGMVALTALVQLAGSIPVQWREGLLTPELLWMALWGGLAGSVGAGLALPVLERIDEDFFRGLLLAILAFSVAILLTKALLLV